MSRAANSLFLPDNLQRAEGLIATLREVADAHSATPAQIALAWVIHRPAVAAIPGASSVEQLESNVAAAEIELAGDEYQALQAALARYGPIAEPAALSRRSLSALKHWAKTLECWTKTVRHDYELEHIPPSGDAGKEK